ncbi:hypothetical protein CGRA01v4_08140 [Colletotrichum graminicola]|nr:hypothetical protein CGRA01v4_08140 [Colletotrichum graminicola]
MATSFRPFNCVRPLAGAPWCNAGQCRMQRIESAFRRVSKLQPPPPPRGPVRLFCPRRHRETQTLISAGKCPPWQLRWRSTTDVIGGYEAGEARGRRSLRLESNPLTPDPLVVVRIDGWWLVLCLVCWLTAGVRTQSSNSLSVVMAADRCTSIRLCLCTLVTRLLCPHLKFVTSPMVY